MKKELITYRDPKSPLSEVFRTLRTNIQFTNMNKKSNIILITSAAPGEGKSWVASNLAVTFAQASKRVLLIDGDMRKGRLFNVFETSPRPGLSNFLAEEAEYADFSRIQRYMQNTGIENLYMISAGTVPPNPSELLVKKQMETLLEKIREVFDIVIIDGTPCSLVTDSIILSRIVDSTIVVASYGETKREDLNNTVKALRNVGAHLAGIVMNKMPKSKKKYNQSYYYGSTLTVSKKKGRKEGVRKYTFNRVSADEFATPRDSENEEMEDTNTDNIINQVNDYLKDDE